MWEPENYKDVLSILADGGVSIIDMLHHELGRARLWLLELEYREWSVENSASCRLARREVLALEEAIALLEGGGV